MLQIAVVQIVLLPVRLVGIVAFTELVDLPYLYFGFSCLLI